MTAKKLHTLAVKWMERLELTDWKLTLSFKRPEDMTVKGTAGSSGWEPEYNTVDIEISQDHGSDEEIEETLVHELLHLRHEGHKVLSKGYRYDPLYERSLNVLAKLLVTGPPKRKRKT